MTKKETKSLVLLQHHLKSLKLPTMLSECEKIAGRCAADNVDPHSHRTIVFLIGEILWIYRRTRWLWVITTYS